MQGGPEELDEHMAKDHEFDDAPNRYVFKKLLYSYLLYNLKMLIVQILLNFSENGKELKNKMVSKLGEILDQALKNLISSTQKP